MRGRGRAPGCCVATLADILAAAPEQLDPVARLEEGLAVTVFLVGQRVALAVAAQFYVEPPVHAAHTACGRNKRVTHRTEAPEIGVAERLLWGDPPGRIEAECSVDQIRPQWACTGWPEHLLELPVLGNTRRVPLLPTSVHELP